MSVVLIDIHSCNMNLEEKVWEIIFSIEIFHKDFHKKKHFPELISISGISSFHV